MIYCITSNERDTALSHYCVVYPNTVALCLQENLQAMVDCSFSLVDITAVKHENETSLRLTVQFGARTLRVQCYTKERTDDWYRDLCYHALKKDK